MDCWRLFIFTTSMVAAQNMLPGHGSNCCRDEVPNTNAATARKFDMNEHQPSLRNSGSTAKEVMCPCLAAAAAAAVAAFAAGGDCILEA